MKKVLLISFALIVGFGALAQDVIILTNGDEIEAVVIKITESELEYKRYDNPDGPSYVRSLDKIFMVKYENGTKDVFTTPESVRRQPVKEADMLTMGERTPLTLSRKVGNIVSNKGSLKNEDLKRMLGDAVYDEYMSAHKGYETGNMLVGFGWAAAVVGTTSFLAATVSASDGATSIASTLSFVGVMAFLGHSIMVPVGYVITGVNMGRISRIAEAYNNYNKGVSMEMRMSPLLLVSNGNIATGIGVAVRF